MAEQQFVDGPGQLFLLNSPKEPIWEEFVSFAQSFSADRGDLEADMTAMLASKSYICRTN